MLKLSHLIFDKTSITYHNESIYFSLFIKLIKKNTDLLDVESMVWVIVVFGWANFSISSSTYFYTSGSGFD